MFESMVDALKAQKKERSYLPKALIREFWKQPAAFTKMVFLRRSFLVILVK